MPVRTSGTATWTATGATRCLLFRHVRSGALRDGPAVGALERAGRALRLATLIGADDPPRGYRLPAGTPQTE